MKLANEKLATMNIPPFKADPIRKTLAEGIMDVEFVDKSSWVYYSFDANYGKDIEIVVSSIYGDPDLFVNIGTTDPSTSSADYSSYASEGNKGRSLCSVFLVLNISFSTII